MWKGDQWEYLTRFFWASAQDKEHFLRQRWPDWRNVPKYAPEALIPDLNDLGKDGWELVHMEPVVVGKNYDVGVHFATGGNADVWSNIYFCAFKRRIPA